MTNELEHIAKLEKELAKLKATIKMKGVPWIPKINARYYVTINGCTDWHMWRNDVTDNQYRQFGNMYKTSEEAEDANRRNEIRTKLKNAAGGWKPDWVDVSYKYLIYFDWDTNKIAHSYASSYQNIDEVYFETSAAAQAAIDEIGEEDLKFLIGIE